MEIDFSVWKWSCNIVDPPKKAGVYVITDTVFSVDYKSMNREIVYIGSSKNLFRRKSNHPIMRLLGMQGRYCQFYYLLIDNILEVEKELIGKYNPKYNKQWRKD